MSSVQILTLLIAGVFGCGPVQQNNRSKRKSTADQEILAQQENGARQIEKSKISDEVKDDDQSSTVEEPVDDAGADADAGDPSSTPSGQATPAAKPGPFAIERPLGKTNTRPTINWTASKDAAGYRVAVASDSKCQNVLKQTVIDNPNATSAVVGPLPIGDAFVCVLALDANKVESAADNNAVAIKVQQGWFPINQVGAPLPRSMGGATAVVGDKVLIYSGLAIFRPPQPVIAFEAYDLKNEKWVSMPTANMPQPRTDYNFVAIDKTKAVLIGGRTSGGNDVAVAATVFDSVAQTWTNLQPPAGFLASSQLSSVFTGKEIIIYGGMTRFSGVLSTGFAYDVAKKTWRQISAAGSPGARAGHCAAWTGTEMIIVGGGTISLALNNGFVYNPAKDTWRSISMAGAPPIGVFSACVWTGDRLLTFSGSTQVNRGDVVAMGGFYDPAKDSWTQVVNSGVLPRFTEMFAWTGDALFIWGGAIGSVLNPNNNGVMYYP